jgi:hypothetical protein
VTVPSESQKGASYYDVVIQFMPPDDAAKRALNVENYYVQFFSNSPGFYYKYAALYKLEGYLIEALYDKYPQGALDTLPEKANKSFELYFDSSIYYASRYLLDHKMFTLGKFNLRLFKKKSPERFFSDIQDIETVGIMRQTADLHKAVEKEIEKDTKMSVQQEGKLSKNSVLKDQILHRKSGKTYTDKDPSNVSIKRITSSKSTVKSKDIKGLKRVSATTNTSKTKSSVVRKKSSKSTTKKTIM